MKRGKQAMPQSAERKADTTKNANNIELDKIVKSQLQKDKKKYPLRISKTTVLYVTKDKCTPEYAEQCRKRMGLSL